MGGDRRPRRRAEEGASAKSKAGRWLETARGHWVALLLWLGFAVTLARALHGPRGLEGLLNLRAELRAVRTRDGELLQQSTDLREALRRLRDDERELERVARSRLRLTRPGETLYVLGRRATPPARERRFRFAREPSPPSSR